VEEVERNLNDSDEEEEKAEETRAPRERYSRDEGHGRDYG